MNKFIKEILNFKRGNLTVQELIQYERLGILSDAQIRDIMSKPGEEAQKLSSVIIPTLNEGVVGKEIRSGEKEDLFASLRTEKNALREYFCHFAIAREYGEYLLSILPDCPLIERNILMDQLLILAEKQNETLKALVDSNRAATLLPGDARNGAKIARIYSNILCRIGMFDDKSFENRLIPVIRDVSSATKKTDVINAFVSHYSQKREYASNVGGGIKSLHSECIKCTDAMQSPDFGILDSYIEATNMWNDGFNEYSKVNEEAKLYYLH